MNNDINVIVETDLGRDPDDLFAILYLVSAGVNIRCITISPGDQDQISIAKFICKELGLNIPIGTGKAGRNKTSSGGVHYELLKKYHHSLNCSPDGLGEDIIADTMNSFPDSELFAIGPLASVGGYLRKGGREFVRSTMQGGFVGYNLHNLDVPRLEKFEGLSNCPTFNMNGDISGIEALLASDTDRYFVGKNVCHTIVYNRDVYNQRVIPSLNRAMELFSEAMGMYLNRHGEKKFHDPTAAVCFLYPEIGTWYRGELYREKGGWGTMPGGNDSMLVDINRDMLWDHLQNGY